MAERRAKGRLPPTTACMMWPRTSGTLSLIEAHQDGVDPAGTEARPQRQAAPEEGRAKIVCRCRPRPRASWRLWRRCPGRDRGKGLSNMTTHGLRRTFRERAVAVGITPQVLFDWLRRGRLTGKQLAKGMPWQITLTPEQAIELRAKVRRTNRSRIEAS